MNDGPRHTLPESDLISGDTVEVDHHTLADVARGEWGPAVDIELEVSDLEDLSLVARIGRGGMGVVYRALQQSLERDVAVKLLDPAHGWTDEQVERFHQEVLLAASLNHPNIAHIHWIKRQEYLFYFVMEFVDGVALDEYLGTRSPALSDLLEIFCQVCDGLAHAHERGIVHRDLKPGNILVETASERSSAPGRRRPGRAVLVDFGLAARHGESSTNSQGLLMGTPAYMSPEQASGGPTDHRSDLYSLGVTLFESVTGRVPFSAPTPLAMAFKHISDFPPDPRSLAPALPDELAELINALLEKDPADRPQTVDDVRERLAAALRRAEAASRATPAVTPIETPGLAQREVTVLAVALDGFLAHAHDQAVARTTFMLESWMELVERAVTGQGGQIVRQEASLIAAVFNFPERASDHTPRAIRALKQLARAIRDFNRTHGRHQAFTAGLETGRVFVGLLGTASKPICFGRPLDTAIRLSRVRHCGLGLTGPGLSDKPPDDIPLQPLIGVADDLGSASRIAPEYWGSR